jgi:hypothetical protein
MISRSGIEVPVDAEVHQQLVLLLNGVRAGVVPGPARRKEPSISGRRRVQMSVHHVDAEVEVLGGVPLSPRADVVVRVTSRAGADSEIVDESARRLTRRHRCSETHSAGAISDTGGRAPTFACANDESGEACHGSIITGPRSLAAYVANDPERIFFWSGFNSNDSLPPASHDNLCQGRKRSREIFRQDRLCRFGTSHAAHLAASTPARECHASEMMDSGLLPRVMLVTQRRHLAMAQMLEFA